MISAYDMYLLQYFTHSCTIPLYTSYYIQLTNVKDCLARGFIKEGETPLEVAAQQLIKDNINVSLQNDMYIRFTFCTAHLTWYIIIIIGHSYYWWR